MEPDVLTVREAAERLGVSSQRVRQLIYDGSLPARRASAGWLIPASAVTDRARTSPPGRPSSPRTAWAVLELLSAAAPASTAAAVSIIASGYVANVASDIFVEGLKDAEVLQGSKVVSDRRLRHHALRLLRTMPDPVEDTDRWRTLLASRGRAQRMWAHPGVLPRLEDDPRVSVGGADAASHIGDGLSRVGQLDLYVSESDLNSLVSEYRLRSDTYGQVVLRVVPSSVPDDLAPQRGESVPAAAAAADLLEEGDPRAEHAALAQLRAMRNALVHSVSPPSSAKRNNADAAYMQS